MPGQTRPANYAPIGFTFFDITTSVSTEASAVAAGVGPFAGLYIKTSTSLSITSFNGNTMVLDNIAKNTTIWVSGAFVSAIVTATSQFGLL